MIEPEIELEREKRKEAKSKIDEDGQTDRRPVGGPDNHKNSNETRPVTSIAWLVRSKPLPSSLLLFSSSIILFFHSLSLYNSSKIFRQQRCTRYENILPLMSVLLLDYTNDSAPQPLSPFAN